MTRRNARLLIVESKNPQQCDDCGKIRDLRPYGPGGSMICFPCSEKDPEGTKRRFQRMMPTEKDRFS